MVLPLPIGDDVKRRGRPAWATLAVILLCLVLFLPARYLDAAWAAWIVRHGPLVPADFLALWRGVGATPALLWQAPGEVLRRGVLPLITHPFLHAQEIQLLGNLLFLWIFGRSVESRLGPIRFFLFFLSCGLAAMAAHVALAVAPQVPMAGSTGAVAGVLGGYLCLHPRARVRLLVWFVIPFFCAEAPAPVFILVWFIFQVINSQETLLRLGDMRCIAYWAQAAGFLAGLILLWVFRPGRRSGGGKAPSVGR